MTNARTLLVAASTLTAALCLSVTAAAGQFSADGTFHFNHDAQVQQGFEQDVQLTGASHEIIEDTGALEGERVLSVTATYQSVNLPVKLDAQSRRVYRASAWTKGDAVIGIVMGYPDGTAGTYAQLFPTGRMTSDGWVEMKSAPFSVDGPLKPQVEMFFFGTFQADAVEIVPDTAPYRAPQRCDGALDPSCDGDRVCLSGWCRDPNGWMPPLPPETKREKMVEYLSNRLRYFFGPYENRRLRLPLALESMKAMKHTTSRWEFWNGFATAVRRLSDSHTRSSSLYQWIISNDRPMNVCFVIGQADVDTSALETGPEMLVGSVGKKYTWGLKPGDRLVSIDHISPIAWARSMIGVDWNYPSVDDQSSLSMVAEQLRLSIPRFASNITVVHCADGACGPPEDIQVSDIPEVAPGTQVRPVMCDNRFEKVVASQPSSHDMGLNTYYGPVLGTQPDEKIYGMVFDALLVSTPGASAISSAVKTWRNDAKGVIIDHRLGNGGQGALGTTASADPIIAFVRPATFLGVLPWRQAADDEGPASLADGVDLIKQYEQTHAAWRGGSDTARTDVPVALLITRDVSFSDLFSHAMKGSPRVRIFGPHPTNGAFSSFLSLSYGFGIQVQIAAGDVIANDGSTLCGHGVQPDEVIWPLQSDIMAGRDTLLSRALQWVREEAVK